MSDDPDTGEPDGDDARGDPFDSFDEYRDREGDPFGSLGDDPAGDVATGSDDGGTGDADASPTPASADDSAASESTDAADPDPFEYMGDRGGGSEREDRGDERGDGPLADVTVSDEDPFESSASAFERSGAEGIDPDEVWDRLTAEPDASEGADAVGDRSDSDEDDDIVTVSKHGYCEGCEHFSAPPDVACGHEGTDILEFVGVDSVRVSNCPVVDERRELEDDA
ncbi:hypothetical protein C475_08441 [Halosimplex carlsbadense 2-9-1]|uniref:DUF8135 domain-containing protein n=1 Tax=Halosimplex carlsbadense 2-9-1 TaxID=797114 RepID=M0CYI9_9EURY|nr:hypothetical protein [Halosimplex carlsbadense]ELZ26949.1 hypothetical protein C475_08441 [Halosimplex carlsbadense 2-9-1]